MKPQPNPRDATLDRLAARAIGEGNLFPDSASPVVVAVSGGADSMALLHFTLAWSRAEARRGAVVAAHVNHGLRGGESDEDAAFVRREAEAWGATVEIAGAAIAPESRERAAAGAAIEAAARAARYDALRTIAARHGADRIVTAHTADDQAETVLLRLVRGAGLRGLGGMARRSRVHGVRVVRPLLGVTRHQVIEYATRHGVPFREDASNASGAAARNYVRHEIVPRLTARLNPAVREALLRAASSVREADAYLERRARRLYRRVLLERGGENMSLDARALLHYPKLLRTYIFRHALADLRGERTGNLQDVSSVHLRALHRLIESPRGGHHVDLPGELAAERRRDRMILSRRDEPARRKSPSKA